MTDFYDAPELAAAGRSGFDSAEPLPLEIPVHVRGLVGDATNLGADCAYEPFCEDTLTVLVSKHSAVLRLAAQAVPGQTITITSPGLGRELSARVVRYRSHPDVKGYAEIEFTRAEPHAVVPAAPDGTLLGIPVTGLPVTELDAQLDSRYATPAMPMVVTPLADLLTATPRCDAAAIITLPLSPTNQSVSSSHSATDSGRAPSSSAQIPSASFRAKPRARKSKKANAARSVDLETLLAKRAAVARAMPSAQQLAARLLLSDPGVASFSSFSGRPRKRWLAAVAAMLLTLGAAGAWAVARGVGMPSPWPLPDVAAFALPEPPPFVASALVAAPRHLFETEPAAIATRLTPPASLLYALPAQFAAPVARRAPAVTEPPASVPVLESTLSVAAPNALATFAPSGGVGAAPAPPPPATAAAPVVKQPVLLSQAAVEYPQFARQARVEGDVIIDARIDETGRVSRMRVISGPAVLRQAAQDSLAQWRYQPATLNGQPVATHLYVTIQFRR